MKFNLFYFRFILIVAGAATTSVQNAIDTHQNNKLTNMDVLLERIKDRKWNKEDQPCLDMMVEALTKTKNFTLWAVWMVDSMQLPVGQMYGSQYHIGNYDECMNPPWIKTHPKFKTQYCVADLHLTVSTKNKNFKAMDPMGSASRYFKIRSSNDRDFSRMTWGTCVPEVCKPSAVVKIYRTLLDVSHLGHFSDEAKITITSCEAAGRLNEWSTGVTWLKAIVGILFITAYLSTFYTRKYYKPESKSYFQEAIRAFCLRRNTNSLATIRNEEIYIFNLLRMISSMTIVLGHIAFALYGRMITNGLKADKEIEDDPGFVHHLELTVDTFFVLSGFLIARGFLNGSWSNPFKFMVKRYMRIGICVAFVTYIKTYVSYYVADGPFWPKLAGPERDACAQNGWQNLAMTNVYLAESKACYIVSWYPTVDFHMSLIAVILCCMYKKSKWLAVTTFWILLIMTMGAAGATSYIKQLPSSVFYGIESVVNYRENMILKSIYITTHTRAGTYLVGVAFGCIFGWYKPDKYRNVMSKKLTLSIIIAAQAVMFGILVVGHHFYVSPTQIGIALFTAVHRCVWAVMVGITTCACEYGNIGGVRGLVNWSPLVPLSRLTFGVFLLHMIFVEHIVLSTKSLYTWSLFKVIVEALGIMVVTFLSSFLMWLLLEAPSMNLTDLLLNGIKTKKSTPIETSNSNGDVAKPAINLIAKL